MPPLNPNASLVGAGVAGDDLRYDDNYTKAQLIGVGWEKSPVGGVSDEFELAVPPGARPRGIGIGLDTDGPKFALS